MKDDPPGQSIQQAIKYNINTDAFPPSPSPNIKTNDVVYNIIEASPKDLAHTNLTGSFPYQSSRGNEYIFVGFHYDANAILVEPIKNRQAGTLTDVWSKMNTRFVQAGVQPHTYMMDNEISKHMKDAFTRADIKYQLVPPYCHRVNAAERAIQTFKHHLNAGLATVDPDFSLREWDSLLPQGEPTLNLLRASQSNHVSQLGHTFLASLIIIPHQWYRQAQKY